MDSTLQDLEESIVIKEKIDSICFNNIDRGDTSNYHPDECMQKLKTYMNCIKKTELTEENKKKILNYYL
jgi:hypothetical protein